MSSERSVKMGVHVFSTALTAEITVTQVGRIHTYRQAFTTGKSTWFRKRHETMYGT